MRLRMASGEFMMWSASVTGLVFVFALGAIVGSFINVVAYRVPAGIGIVTPPSSCPACGTRLTWRENFPILGWIWLGGKCRFCRSRISAQYPLIELLVALLFALLFALWYMQPSVLSVMGVPVRAFQPEFVRDGLARTWPVFVAVLFLVGSLVAITLVDAKTFTIPLPMTVWPAAVGLAAHAGNAAWLEFSRGGLRAGPGVWAIPTVSGPLLGASIGASMGVALAAALLHTGRLPRSFADFADWEEKHAAAKAAAGVAGAEGAGAGRTGSASGAGAPSKRAGTPLRVALLRTVYFTGPAVALMFVGFAALSPYGRPIHGMAIGGALGLLIGLFLRRLAPDEGHYSADPLWIEYPWARREMPKEILFLLPAAALGAAGFWLCRAGGPLGGLADAPPLWLRAAGGSMLGFLVGGGVVWVTRILGTLAFGREAMGMGDVHLMAAVGAVLGWVTPVLAFFTAPFLGLAWAVASVAFRRLFPRVGTALPYGPHLAAGTVLVLYLRPVYEFLLTVISGGAVRLP